MSKQKKAWSGRPSGSAPSRQTQRPVVLPASDVALTANRFWRPLALRLAAVAAGLIAALGIAELGLRVLGIRPERYPQPRWLAWDGAAYRDLGILGQGLIKQPSRFSAQGVTMGEYVPGARFKTVFATNPRGYFDSDCGVGAEINRLGLRGPEISKEKPRGVFRILGLGDSFTFGVGVRDPDTFLRRLETRLNQESGGSPEYQVLNAGVQGYNTRDEVLYLEHRWLALAPDLVLIVFYLNDAYTDTKFLNMGQIQGVDLKPTGLGRFSYVYDLATHVYHVRRLRRQTDEYYRAPYFTDPGTFLEHPGDEQADWTACRAALAHAAVLCRDRKIGLALVIFPELHRLDSGYPFMKIHELVKSTAASLSMPVLDLLDVFRPRRDADLWVHPSDHHPNEVAHRLAAEAIDKFLHAEGLLTVGDRHTWIPTP